MCERSDAELREIFQPQLSAGPVKLERTYEDQEGDPLSGICFEETKPQQMGNVPDFDGNHPQAEAHEIPVDFKMVTYHLFDENIPELKDGRARKRKNGDKAKTKKNMDLLKNTSIDQGEKKDPHDGLKSIVTE